MTEDKQLLAFERFYSIYPRKIAKGNARKAWLKLVKGMNESELEQFTVQIVGAVDSQNRYRKQKMDKGEWVPDIKHPASWLNSEAWTDVLDDWEKKKQIPVDQRICEVEGCPYPVHGARFTTCTHHHEHDPRGRLNRERTLVPELLDYYRNHPEIHNITGRDAAQWIKRNIGNLSRKTTHN